MDLMTLILKKYERTTTIIKNFNILFYSNDYITNNRKIYGYQFCNNNWSIYNHIRTTTSKFK